MEAGKFIPDVKPGDYFTLKLINSLIDEVNRLNRLSVAGGEAYDLPGCGVGVRPSEPDWIYAKLTSQSGSTFAWTEQIPASGGAFTAGSRSGTTSSDPAYEANGASPTLPLNAVLRRARGGSWIFVVGGC
jgi:hypothetical protein